jgi:methyltransferase-like protein/2-polyprenyl-3-methyl-5-hydroxy-6-metoxy-1,4-benzoquinol methylase
MTTIYDQIPYPQHSYGFTHPDRLATLATLHGMSPTPIENCRVLELGCASGSNLIPMAYALPQSEFVGLDLSQRQIAVGQRFIDAVALTNIRLLPIDIRAVDESFGQFDYIIAHGVHSWVPPDVQEALMRICSRHLSAQGVALVSYNAYPGCHLRQMVRGMAQFHLRDIDDPTEQVEQLHALVRFLGDSLGDDYKGYRQIVQSESERLAKLSDAFLFHDVLEPTNLPVYFHQFIEQAARHGLQYLAEALPMAPERSRLAAEAREELERHCDLVEFEQHLDFLDGTSFRRTLVCRDSVRLNRDLQAAPLERLFVASQARPVSAAPDLASDRPEEFDARKGPLAAALRCDSPIGKAALVALAEAYPRAVRFDDVTAIAGQRLGRSTTACDESEIRKLMVGGFEIGAIELHAWQPQMADGASARPEASPIARYEAAQGAEATTLWHERLVLSNPASRHLLAGLDGGHDRQAIVDWLTSAILADQMSQPGARMASKSEVRAEVAQQIDAAIGDLARAAVLIS